jgi:hypothetical protein
LGRDATGPEKNIAPHIPAKGSLCPAPDAFGDDVGAETGRGRAPEAAVEDELDLVGSAQVEVSRMTCSKKKRPVNGLSKTWVSENSDCRMEMS